MTKFLTTILLAAFASTSAAPFSLNNITERESRLEAALASTTPSGPTIINDEFDRARAEANKRKLPLFVEVWAPW